MYLPPLIGPLSGAEARFDVFAATSPWQRRDAARVPWAVYRRDRRWTPPLLREWQRMLDPARGSWLTQSAHALFLAETRNLGLGDQVAGRLAAWADPQGGSGCFGLFEAINNPDLVEALFSAAEAWLFEYVAGLRSVRGPLGLEPFRPAGLLVDGFAAQPAAFLPYNPPYYPELVSSAGYEPGPAQHAYQLDLSAAAGAGGGVGSVRVAGVDAWPAWRSVVADLYGQALPGQTAQPDTDAGGAASAGMPLALVNLLADGEDVRLGLEGRLAVRWLQRRLLVAVVEAAGQPVAAALVLPDISRALRLANGRLLPFGWLPYALSVRGTRRLHCLPAAVLPAWQGQGVALALYRALSGAALAGGFISATAGPFWADDEVSAQAMNMLGATRRWTYRIHSKTF